MIYLIIHFFPEIMKKESHKNQPTVCWSDSIFPYLIWVFRPMRKCQESIWNNLEFLYAWLRNTIFPVLTLALLLKPFELEFNPKSLIYPCEGYAKSNNRSPFLTGEVHRTALGTPRRCKMIYINSVLDENLPTAYASLR